MTTNTFPVFFNSVFLADSNGGVWTMPSSAASTTILQELTLKFTNTTAATRLVTAHAFSSGSASSANAIVKETPVPPYDYILVPVPRIEGTDAAIQGFCDIANSVTVAPIGGKLHVP